MDASHTSIFQRASCRIGGGLLGLLMLAGPSWAECPDPSTYSAAEPVLLGSYSPFDLRMNAPAPVSCAGTGPNTPCSPHRVYLPDGTERQPPAMVFLPGSGMEPEKHDLVLQMAAYAGYRTIGLAYDNVGMVATLCGSPSCADDCAERLHIERITGQDVSPIVATATGDSILYRLYALLVELHAEDMADASNDLQWDELFTPHPPGATSLGMSAIRWDRIFIAGFSQGGGHAAFIAKNRVVSAVMILDSGGDFCVESPGVVRAEDWIQDPANASADRPHFGATHTKGEPEPYPKQLLWTALGFGEVPGEDLDVPPLEMPPPSAAYTNQSPASDVDPSCSEHASMAKDTCMPTSAASASAALSPESAHLFEPYLLRLCEACTAPGCTTNTKPLPSLHVGWLAGLIGLILVAGARAVRRPERAEAPI